MRIQKLPALEWYNTDMKQAAQTNKNTKPAPKVGIGVFVFKDGQFLMGCRKNTHGAEQWSVPGGHIEFGETFEQTAAREVFEETGITIKNIRFGAVTNDHFEKEGKHYISIWMLSDWESGSEQVLEPEKFVTMRWHSFDALPVPLFAPWQQLLASQFIDTIQQELASSRQA